MSSNNSKSRRLGFNPAMGCPYGADSGAKKRMQEQQRLDAEAMARTSDEEYWKSYTEGAHKQ